MTIREAPEEEKQDVDSEHSLSSYQAPTPDTEWVFTQAATPVSENHNRGLWHMLQDAFAPRSDSESPALGSLASRLEELATRPEPLTPSPEPLTAQPGPLIPRSQRLARYCLNTLHCPDTFMSSAHQKDSPWTAQLGLYWYKRADFPDKPPAIPTTWRTNLDKCIKDEITVTVDPLCPRRMVYMRTISVEYVETHQPQGTPSQGRRRTLEIRLPGSSLPPAVARVDVCLYSKDLEWLQTVEYSTIGEQKRFTSRATCVLYVHHSYVFLAALHSNLPYPEQLAVPGPTPTP